MNRKRQASWLGALLLAGMIVGCGEEPSSTVGVDDAMHGVEAAANLSPQAQAQAVVHDMLTLAKAGQWGAMIDEYYGESHKFTSPADRDALAERFAEKWGQKLIPALEQAAAVPPTIDGDKAVFGVDGSPVYILHREDDGRWMFHL